MNDQQKFRAVSKLFLDAGQKLHKCRFDSRSHSELGDYYATDIETGHISAKHIDLDVAIEAE